MNDKQLESIINLHRTTSKLKTMLRQGWLGWKVEDDRIESIAEHIFGTCMLAISIYASEKMDLDISKVITMLVLHETEEIIIGDLTPFDTEKLQTQKIDGRNAVLQIFKDFPNSQYFLDIIEEFEQNETKEAKFALFCDKFECDLQARLYEGKFHLDKVDKKIMTDPRTVALVDKGFNTGSQIFLQHSKPRYQGIFLELANKLEEMEEEEKQGVTK